VVTGAASGIGAAISVAFAQEGAQVALVDLAEPAAAEPVLAAVCGHARQAVYVQTDVADEQAVGEMARSVLAHFGRVDVLVNNAGHACPVNSAGSSPGTVLRTPWDQVSRPRAAPVLSGRNTELWRRSGGRRTAHPCHALVP